jgi:hypothetical protein
MQFPKRALRVVALVLGLVVLATATPGSFRGTIVDNPNAAKGWVYVQGRNGTARRVEISRAKILYDEDVPATERRPKPEEALTPGAEVRVTAEQDSDGEWHATQVEILKPAVGAERLSIRAPHRPSFSSSCPV